MWIYDANGDIQGRPARDHWRSFDVNHSPTEIRLFLDAMWRGPSYFRLDWEGFHESTDPSFSPDGQKIAFLGDSITAAGAKQGGYCQLVLDGLKREGITVCQRP